MTAIIALIGVSMGLLDDAFKRVSSKRFLVQSDVLLSNMFDVLKQNSGDVNDSATLDIFLAVPFAFENKAFDTSATIVFESSASKPNINWLVDANSTKKKDTDAPVPLNPAMEEYLDRILSVYNVSDKILLVSMIADAIDSDLDERTANSEIALENPDFSQGRLYDLHHLKQVVEAYERMTLDTSVEMIPWEDLVGFDNDSVDFNHISAAALQLMVPELEPEQAAKLSEERTEVYTSMDALPFDTATKEKLKQLKVGFYNPKVSGDILIKNGERRMHVTFLYDLHSKEVRDIEITQ